MIPFNTKFAGLEMIVDCAKPEMLRVFYQWWPKVSDVEADIITRANILRSTVDPLSFRCN